MPNSFTFLYYLTVTFILLHRSGFLWALGTVPWDLSLRSEYITLILEFWFELVFLKDFSWVLKRFDSGEQLTLSVLFGFVNGQIIGAILILFTVQMVQCPSEIEFDHGKLIVTIANRFFITWSTFRLIIEIFTSLPWIYFTWIHTRRPWGKYWFFFYHFCSFQFLTRLTLGFYEHFRSLASFFRCLYDNEWVLWLFDVIWKENLRTVGFLGFH